MNEARSLALPAMKFAGNRLRVLLYSFTAAFRKCRAAAIVFSVGSKPIGHHVRFLPRAKGAPDPSRTEGRRELRRVRYPRGRSGAIQELRERSRLGPPPARRPPFVVS